MLDQPFYDDVHRWTFDRKSAFAKQAGGIDQHLMHYRRLVRGAQRFVVEDDMLALAVQLSNTPDQHQFDYWGLLARLPYDVMWFEWDQHERLRISQKLGKLEYGFNPSEVSREHGMLLVRDPDHRSRWTCNLFARMQNDEVFINPITFVYDPDGTEEATSGLVAFGANRQIPLTQQVGLQPYLEYVSLGYSTLDDKGKHAHTAPPWSINKVGAIAEPIWWQWRQQRLSRTTVTPQLLAEFNEPYLEQFVENRGILRSAIVLLSMLNNVPHVRREVRPRKGYRPMLHNRVQYLGHNVVTLKLPKTRQIEYIQQKLRLGYGRLRRHDVRGFYRRVNNDRSRMRCHHIPTADSTSDHITCGRCGHEIRWVDEYQRGDERLGWVHKQYRIGVND